MTGGELDWQVLKQFKTKKGEESAGERNHWRMDRSRSGGETEERETCGGRINKRGITKERDRQHKAASSTSLLLQSFVFMLNFQCTLTQTAHSGVTVIDSFLPTARSKAKDFIINRTRFNLLLQAEQRCSLHCLFMNEEHRGASMVCEKKA